MELKDVLAGAQLLVTAGLGIKLVWTVGRFTEKVDTGLSNLQGDLKEHTDREEKRFDEIRSKLHSQSDKLQEVVTVQATHHTRINHLEAVGGKK